MSFPHTYALDGARADLTAPAEILALMAQDIARLGRQHDTATPPQLMARGWTLPQVDAHFLPALEQAARDWTDDVRAAQAAPFLKFDADMRERLNEATR